MTELPARHLPATLAAPARPGLADDDLGDVLASIRRLIAREDGDSALAGPSPGAAASRTAPTLRNPGGTGLPTAAQPDPASSAVPLQADPTSAQPPAPRPAPHGDAAPLFGASHLTPDRGTVDDSAPLRLRPDALIPPAGTFRRPEGRLRLRSVLDANEAPGGWAAALPHTGPGDTDSSHTAEPPAPTMAVEPAALPEPPAPPSTLLADAPPAPASLRGLVRAAIRQEIEGEIDRLVHGPLHRLIRAEVARAVAEVFDSTEAVRPGQS